MNATERFIVNLAAACGRRVSPETSQLYLGKLSRWSLTDDQWSRACSLMIDRGLDKSMPELPEIYSVLRQVISTTTVAQIPAWRTWKDDKRRTIAQKFGTQDATPGAQTLEQWKREACSREEGRKAFREGYLAAGGDPAKVDEMQRIVETPHEKLARPRAIGRDRQLPPEPELEEVPF